MYVLSDGAGAAGAAGEGAFGGALLRENRGARSAYR